MDGVAVAVVQAALVIGDIHYLREEMDGDGH